MAQVKMTAKKSTYKECVKLARTLFTSREIPDECDIDRCYAVLGPRGQVLAFSMWHDDYKRSGVLELYGVHKGWRGMKLGDRVIKAGLRAYDVVHTYTMNNPASDIVLGRCGFDEVLAPPRCIQTFWRFERHPRK